MEPFTTESKKPTSLRNESQICIHEVESERDVELARQVFKDYADELGIDLEFQKFSSELATLPGPYAKPYGTILLADKGNIMIGTVALRPLSVDVCEMKRLYVYPPYRRSGIGKLLVHSIIKAAIIRRYKKIVLDTLPQMTAAATMYRRFGFEDIDPYYSSPIDGTIFLGKFLDNGVDA